MADGESHVRDDIEERVCRVRELRAAGDRAGALVVAYAVDQVLGKHPELRRGDASLESTYEWVRNAIAEMEAEEGSADIGHLVEEEDVVPGFGGRGIRTASILLVLLVVGVAAAWPRLMAMRDSQLVQDSMSAVLRNIDKRGLDVQVRSRDGVVVVDLQTVPPDWTPEDIGVVLQRFSRVVQERSFTRVELAFRGEVRYWMDGAYFHSLAGAREDPTALWGIPEHLHSPDGASPFPARTGRPVEVVWQQRADYQQMARGWYGG